MILEVIIPTFNRPEQLRQTVRDLLPQMTAESSITLIDNASEPPITFESLGITDLGARLKIRIIRNSVNIGGDANILRCFEVCAAPYLWLLGDDDVLESNAIRIILDNIRNSPNIIFFNYRFRSHRAEDKTTSDLAGFIHAIDFWGDIMLISNSVYNCMQIREAVQSGYHYCYAYSGHVAVLLDRLRRSQGDVLFSRESIIQGHNLMESTYHWSILRYSLSRFALLDMQMDDRLRVLLGKKMLSRTGTLLSGAFILKHAFVYCLILSARNHRREGRFCFDQLVQRTRRYGNWRFSLKALLYGLLLHFPHIMLSFIRILGKSGRLSTVMKQEKDANETV